MPVKKKIALMLHINTHTYSHKILQCLITFLLTAFAWLFFRAESVGKAVLMIKYIFMDWKYVNGAEVGLNAPNVALLLVATAILMLISVLREKDIHLSDRLLAQNDWFKVMVTFAITLSVLVFGVWGGGYNEASFIYFQF